MYEVIHNFMEARVQTAGEEGTKTTRLVLANEIQFSPDVLPFLEPCFPQKVDAQTQSEDAGIPPSPPKIKEMYIDIIPDHQSACVGTQKITGRKHVTLEHISGDDA